MQPIRDSFQYTQCFVKDMKELIGDKPKYESNKAKLSVYTDIGKYIHYKG